MSGKRVEHFCVEHYARLWAFPNVTECPFQGLQRREMGRPTSAACDIRPVTVIFDALSDHTEGT